MTRRTSGDIQNQIDQLEKLKKEVLAKERAKARKERTKRLIERGAILEQYLNGPEQLTNEDISEIVKFAFNTTYVKNFLKEFQQRKAGV